MSDKCPTVSQRIAILTMSFGAGHVRASSVIARALGDSHDKVEVRILDALEFAQPWFLWFYVRSYWWMLRHAPNLWRSLYERRHRKRHELTAPRWFFRWGCKRVLQELKSYAPHLIIATEVGAVEIAALGKREGWFNMPILAAQTDFETEPPWVQPEIDFYCVGSGEAKAQLIAWGVSPNRVLVCGIPVDPVFSLPFDKPAALKSFGLSQQHPVVLVMAGGMGPVPLDQVVLTLERCQLPLQVLVLAGHDAPMRERLESLRGKVALDLHVLGWTERVPELMAAADLLITKPGGMTTAEALSVGLPMILTHPIPGPEERHVHHLVERGVATYASNLAQIPQLIRPLLAHGERKAGMARRARELARPEAAHAVAQVSRALLEKSSYIELLRTPPLLSGESAYLM